MRTIYGIGEALLDIIFKNDQPVGATAGGSTLNAMVSLGRMGHQPQLISEIGNDRIGDIINRFLLKNGVSNQFLFRKKENRSPLALAFLNDANDAEYELFKDYSAQSLTGEIPPFKENDIVMFGSFFALNPALRPQLINYLKTARDKGAIIIYDPNYRSHHSHRTHELKPVIEENFSLATIVRGSDEDFRNIFGLETPEKMAEEINRFCPNAIITANSTGTYISTSNVKGWLPSLTINSVSTIGAGDNFNAGMVHGIVKQAILHKDISLMTKKQWETIIASAVAFATEVCQSLDNYVPENFETKMNHYTEQFTEQLKLE
ncbi:carbohydrate kinase family protein [Geofilum sp. OHC36d9]|uniref:carbohydrate kinase family protein n=1 Tax=Geofilum sp. OHC36d9 TaxID=3458413 RepID=UPI004033D35A